MIANADLQSRRALTYSSHDYEPLDMTFMSESTIGALDYYSTRIEQTRHNNLNSDCYSIALHNTAPCHSSFRRIIDVQSTMMKIFKLIENKAPQPTYIDKNIHKLNQLFTKRLRDYSGKDYSKEIIKKCFDSVAEYISVLNFTDIILFINNTNKIKFSLAFSQDRILVINKSFELVNELNDENLIIFSLFIHDELVASGVAEISNFIDGFKKYLDS